MRRKATIAIAEDHTILREGLHSLLSASKDFDIVGEARDGLEAIRCAETAKPDLMLLDLSMPRMNGLAVIGRIRQTSPQTKILALTAHASEEYVFEAFRLGASGYCLKDSPYSELLVAIETVLSEKRYVSPGISDLLLAGFLKSKTEVKSSSAWDTLTQRERQILKLIGEGYRNKEIAEYLCISAKTAEKHRDNLMKKLNLHSASALTAYALERGLVTKE